MPPTRLLIISLGNPAPYLNTLHSAAHLALSSLPALLSTPASGSSSLQPPFTSQRLSKTRAPTSLGERYILLQSPTLMNVSGPFVAAAYKSLLTTLSLPASDLGLVLVHDDLEEELGTVKVKSWGASHRGHNGVKSVNKSLQLGQYPGALAARICVGIGRPEGRDQKTVSEYVLREMTGREREVIKGQGAEGVVRALGELEGRWASS